MDGSVERAIWVHLFKQKGVNQGLRQTIEICDGGNKTIRRGKGESAQGVHMAATTSHNHHPIKVRVRIRVGAHNHLVLPCLFKMKERIQNISLSRSLQISIRELGVRIGAWVRVTQSRIRAFVKHS